MNSHRQTRRLPRHRGVTLVEMAATLAIVAIVAGAAAPSFEQARERRHLEGAAAQFETDLQFARSEAVAQGRTLRFGFDGAAACYVVHDGAHGDCRCTADGAPVCKAGATPLRSVALPAGTGVRLAANVASMSIDAQYGTVTPAATVRFTGASGAALQQVVNVMGRVRTCAPAGDRTGLRPC